MGSEKLVQVQLSGLKWKTEFISFTDYNTSFSPKDKIFRTSCKEKSIKSSIKLNKLPLQTRGRNIYVTFCNINI